MRSEQLQYFIELGNHRSISSAAEHLHISSQALSISLKNLEEELGLRLLNKSAKGVAFTEDGEQFKQICKQFFDAIDNLKLKSDFKPTEMFRKFDLLSTSGFSELALSPLLEDIYNNVPHANINIATYSHQKLLDYLDEEKFPFALYYKMYINKEEISPKLPDKFHFTPLIENEYFAIVPDSMNLRGYKTISLKKLYQYPIIAYGPSLYLFDAIYHYYPKISPTIIEAPSLVALLSLLGKGAGFTLGQNLIYSQDYILPPKNTHKIKLRENMHVTLGLLTKSNKELSADAQIQINYIKHFYQKCLINGREG